MTQVSSFVPSLTRDRSRVRTHVSRTIYMSFEQLSNPVQLTSEHPRLTCNIFRISFLGQGLSIFTFIPSRTQVYSSNGGYQSIDRSVDPVHFNIPLEPRWNSHRYSLAHPFLLSDNRHYTFYVWRRFLSNSVIRSLIAPAYMFCGWLLMSRLLETKTSLWVLAYAGASAVVLVPSPLLEPR